MSKIFIIEEDKQLAKQLGERLEEDGYEVSIASDIRQTFREVEREQPDLILLDLVLPGLSAIDVCKKLRERSPEIPFILLRAEEPQPDINVDSMFGGSDDYLTRPFSTEDLLSRIRKVMARVDRPKDVRDGEPILLMHVEERFNLEGSGLVVVGVPQSAPDLRYRAGDTVLVKRPDESERRSRITLHFPSPNPRGLITIGIPDLQKEDVPVGSEIWWNPKDLDTQIVSRPGM